MTHSALVAIQEPLSARSAPAAPAQPPDTSTYMRAGYLVAAAIFVAYIALLVARARRYRR